MDDSENEVEEEAAVHSCMWKRTATTRIRSVFFDSALHCVVVASMQRTTTYQMALTLPECIVALIPTQT